MSTVIVATCDRCGVEIVRTSTTMFLEVRNGKHRLRNQVDLCAACNSEFRAWLEAEGKVDVDESGRF